MKPIWPLSFSYLPACIWINNLDKQQEDAKTGATIHRRLSFHDFIFGFFTADFCLRGNGVI